MLEFAARIPKCYDLGWPQGARIPKNLGRQSLPKDTGLGVRLKVVSRGQVSVEGSFVVAEQS